MLGKITGRNSSTDSKATSVVMASVSSSVTVTSSPKIKSNDELGLPKEEDFVNTNYNNWLEIRRQWKSGSGKYARPNGSDRNATKLFNDQVIRSRSRTCSSLDTDEILETIFSNRPSANMVLSEPIPLPQMVDVLLDVWEADGLYD
jgi:hypothetical protein